MLQGTSNKEILYFVVNTVLKLLKMAKGIRALLDTVMQALPQVGNLGLLFFLLFFIFAALGVELFGRLGKLCTNILLDAVVSTVSTITLNITTLIEEVPEHSIINKERSIW